MAEEQKAPKAVLRQSIERRMASGEPFTFGELWRRHSSWTSDGLDPYREADKAIQRWRRRGWIAFVRIGKDVLWTMTEDGKKAFPNV